MFETRITKLFGIKYPIVCGCMQSLSFAEFAAAVSNAGALGTLASVSLSSSAVALSTGAVSSLRSLLVPRRS